MDERWLSIQSNNSFLRYVFTKEETSLYARLHRITLQSVIVYWGINYYDLSRPSINNAYMTALQEVMEHCQRGQVNLVETNLNEYFFSLCRKEMFRTKKKQLQTLRLSLGDKSAFQ